MTKNLTEDAFDLLEYITSGTVARRQVTIYNDPEAGEALAKILERLDELGWSEDPEPGDDRPQDGPLSGDPAQDEIDELLAEAQELQARLEASKSVWTVRALSEEEVERAFDEVPLPKTPRPPKDTAPKKEFDLFHDRAEKWGKDKTEADRERKLALISAAIVTVETPRGSVDSASRDVLRALRSKPQGQQWIDRLYKAVDDAQGSEVDVPRPTSHGRSTTTQD